MLHFFFNEGFPKMLNFTPTLNSNQIRQLRASFSFKSINQANPPFVKPVFNYKVIKTINITKPNVANLCQRQTKFNFVLVKYYYYCEVPEILQ